MKMRPVVARCLAVLGLYLADSGRCFGLVRAADKSGVTPNAISVPKGPGSIEGLGEAFQPTLNTGTAKYNVGLSVPPGTAGHTPKVSISYEGGAGNGPLGFGWRLPVSFVQRQTDKGIPRYVDKPNGVDDNRDGTVDEPAETDVFINDLKEELVPQSDGRFFCKNEGAFIRYRRIADYWEGTLPDGTRIEFGRSPSARIMDPATGRVFSWLVETVTELHGNVIRYGYRPGPDDHSLNQRYLSSIEYGPGRPPWGSFHFVSFQYEGRSDWFEDCRAGFAVRTGLRLREVVIGTQGQEQKGHQSGDFNGDGIPDQLTRKYRINYFNYSGTNSHWSYLSSVIIVGSDGSSTLPSSSFSYSICDPPTLLSAADKVIGGIDVPPFVMDNPLVDLVDLNGDGLPDILKTSSEGGPHIAYLNQGEIHGGGNHAIRWGQGVQMESVDGLSPGINLRSGNEPGEDVAHLADMDGDGMADLVYRTPFDSVYYFSNLGRQGWDSRRAMSYLDMVPPSPFGAENVKTADLDFNKRIDVIQSIEGPPSYRIWFNLGEQRYGEPVTVSRPEGFALSADGVEIADLNGDRVPDICQIRPTAVAVTTGLGHGHFAAMASVSIPDTVLNTEYIRHAKLQDITGDGLADLVVERAEPGTFWYWINLGNYSFSSRHVITGLPTTTLNAAIRWADLNGNGTTDYVVASSDNNPAIQSVDLGTLLGCTSAANLLTRIDNGIGLVTKIEYSSSCQFSRDDALSGQPWPDPMPFPVSVVSRVTTSDSLGHSYQTEFRYHDGYYDGAEKEFRGFARVEQLDIGDATAPTLVTRSQFDTGRSFESMKGKLLRLTQLNGMEGVVTNTFVDEITSWILPPVLLYTGSNGEVVRYAHPTGTARRILELGQGTERHIESESEYDQYGNVTRDVDYGVVQDGNLRALGDERVSKTDYAINTNAWILRAVARTVVSDETGTNVISRSESYYDDPTFSGANFGQVTRGDLTLKLDWSHPATLRSPTNPPPIRSARTRYDTYGNPVLILDPLAEPKTGDPDLSKGHARELAYDPRFQAFPEREIIHLGEGKEPLVFQAKYDEGFGTVLESIDFNGNPTRYDYDVFGRLTSIVRPGDTKAFPTAEYSYALAVPYLGTNLVNYVETRQLDKTNRVVAAKRDSYLIAREFVDGLGRKLISKQEATEAGGPARVSVKGAVRFNARQKPTEALNPFYSSLTGTLDDQLAFESIEAPGWTGQFALSNALVSLNLASAHRSRTTYDATLRELTVTNPDGTMRRTVYEPLLTRSFDENDNDTNSPYAGTPMVHHNDGLGRLVRVDEISRLSDDGVATNALQAWTTRYAYDLNDQLTHIRDSQNNQKWFQYDGLKRKTFMNDPDRGVMKFEYDDASNLLATEDAKGQRIRYTYDGANRIRTEDYLDEGQPFSRNFAFNSLRPVSVTNRADVVYFYDTPLARLDIGDGSVGTATNVKGKLAYVWDLSGEEHTSHDARDQVSWVVKRVRDPLHGQLVSYRTAFDYDNMDRVTGLTYPDNDAIRYRYNDRSLLQTITGGPTGSIVSNLVYLPSDQQREILYGNGIRTAYAYDERLRLKTLNTAPRSNPGSPFIAFDYDFDGVSNIRSITDQRPGTVVPAGDPRRNTQLFQYDDLYRLTRVQYSFALPGAVPANNGEITYRYDRIGNMMAQTSSVADTDPRTGLPVANLGTMESGGTAGRFNRTGRAANDPPGPHALTSLHAPGSPLRAFPYDPNGNMTDLDGMVATWDFKDRLVALEDATMRADYAYDFTDRRITKRVTKKRPVAPTGGEGRGDGVKYSFTTLYVGKHFEVREFDAPTKFVFNGNTRVARVTGTLSPNERVQRLRVHAGWNLLSVAVTAMNGGRQLALSAGGEGQGEAVTEAYRWNPETRTFGAVLPTDTLSAGSVLWVKAAADATLRVTGAYPGPRPNLRGPPEGDFLPGNGLEAWPTSPLNSQPLLTLWRFAPNFQNWQTKLSLPGFTFSDLPAVLAPHEAVYAQAPAPVDLEVPVPALSLRFYHQDHIGSSSVMSDAAGALVEESANFPFGSSRGEFRPRGIREDYRFTQKERDSESGLDYFEARFLLSSCGRFTRVDPLATTLPPGWLSNPQRLDPYSYCGNRPLIATDPSGKSWITKAVKLAIKGGDIAATFADLADNATTVFDSNASVLDRVVAGASIASELLPVSIGDAKDAYRGAKWAANKIDDAKDIKQQARGLEAAGDAARGAATLDASAIRFSQSNVRSSLPEITQSMRANGWQGAPIDVVRMADGGLTAVDNTRLAAASLSRTPVQAVIRNFDDVFPASRAGGNLQGGTWGEALLNRIGGQRPAWQRVYPSGSPFTGVHPSTPGFSP